MDPVANGAAAGTAATEQPAAPAGTAAAGTVSPPAAVKPAKVTGKLSLVVEYTGDVDESKEYSKGIVKSLKNAKLTVKAEFAETMPSKRSL